MSLEWIRVSLRAWDPTGDEIPDAAFFEKLHFAPGDAPQRATGPGVPRVELLSLEAADYSDAPEPSEAFAAALHERLMLGAAWLEKQSPATFDELRQAGIKTDVFIAAWMDADQIDLVLPPEFMRACGARGLSLSLITND